MFFYRQSDLYEKGQKTNKKKKPKQQTNPLLEYYLWNATESPSKSKHLFYEPVIKT